MFDLSWAAQAHTDPHIGRQFSIRLLWFGNRACRDELDLQGSSFLQKGHV